MEHLVLQSRARGRGLRFLNWLGLFWQYMPSRCCLYNNPKNVVYTLHKRAEFFVLRFVWPPFVCQTFIPIPRYLCHIKPARYFKNILF